MNGLKCINGLKLKDIRRNSGKTLRDISITSGVTQGQILNIENGKTENPQINTLINLANALNCDIKDFLD